MSRMLCIDCYKNGRACTHVAKAPPIQKSKRVLEEEQREARRIAVLKRLGVMR